MSRILMGITASLALIGTASAADVTLVNVSYDPTRELYRHLSKAFAYKFKSDTGKTIEVKTSNGGSGAQGASGDRWPRSRCRNAGACV